MVFKLKIPGLDLSATSLPKWKEQIASFDAASLEALYLGEDGTNGANVVSLLDMSGKGRHGTLVAGSVTPVKSAGGVDSAAGVTIGTGFLFETGYPLAGSTTGFVCFSSDDLEAAEATTGYVIPMTTFLNSPLTAAQTISAQDHLVVDRAVRNNTQASSAKTPNLGISRGAGANVFSSGGTRVSLTGTVPVGPSFLTLAWSIGAASKKLRIVTGTSVATIDNTETVFVDSLLAAGRTIKVGIGRVVSQINGQAGIAGLYSKESSIAELQDLIVKMRARMALRGITAY